MDLTDIFAGLWLLGNITAFGMALGLGYYWHREKEDQKSFVVEWGLMILFFSTCSWISIGATIAVFMCEVDTSLQKLSGRDQK